MSRYRGPITRISRRLGLMLFTNGQSKIKAFQKKNYRPGEHGQKRFRQLSEYNKQLQEKQKARFLYGISEKQCKKYYTMASKSEEVTGIQFLKVLETRLDNVIYRSGLAETRPQARQMVSHGLFKVNGKRVKTPSILVNIRDTFEVQDRSKKSKLFENVAKSKSKSPKWIKAELGALKGEVIALPDNDDIEKSIESQLITEFYSK
jgi:small subunit ribosomal protein S4